MSAGVRCYPSLMHGKHKTLLEEVGICILTEVRERFGGVPCVGSSPLVIPRSPPRSDI